MFLFTPFFREWDTNISRENNSFAFIQILKEDLACIVHPSDLNLLELNEYLTFNRTQ